MQQFPHVPVLSVPRPTSLNVLVCCGVVDRVVYMFQNSDSVFLVWSPPTSEDLGLISIFHRFPMRGWKSGLVMINWPPLSPECCSPYMKEILLPSWQCNTITIITSNTQSSKLTICNWRKLEREWVKSNEDHCQGQVGGGPCFQMSKAAFSAHTPMC